MKKTIATMLAVDVLAIGGTTDASGASQRKTAARAKTTATTVQKAAADAAPVLTKAGLGNVKIGMKRSAIPATQSGFYSSMKYVKKDPNEMDIPADRAGWVEFKNNGKTIFAAIIMTNGTVGGIEVYDSAVKTAKGIHVGSKASEVKRLPGATFDQDISTYYAGGMSYTVDPDVTKITTGESLYGY